MGCGNSNMRDRLRPSAVGMALFLSAAACNGTAGTSGSNPARSATLSWSSVTRNTNGTRLKDLAGYKIHYGTSPGALNSVVVLPTPTVTRYIVANLPSGTWYFTVAAYTGGGVDGLPSNVAQKTIP
jgi:hypothetical protein